MPNLEEWISRYNLKRETLEAIYQAVVKGLWVVLAAYLVANLINVEVARRVGGMAVESLTQAMRSTSVASTGSTTAQVRRRTNFHRVRNAILDRNLFNSAGEVPDESVELAEASTSSSFNVNAPCQKNTLNLELMGTIYVGDQGGSLATVKEKGYSEADVYRVGDAVYGNEQALIVKIEAQRVIINNGGKKECLELAPPTLPGNPEGDAGAVTLATGQPGATPPPAGEPGGDVELEAGYVESELGEGYVNILRKARLVPFNKDGSMKGFKLIGLDTNSLIGKVGLRNGDVITQVNDTSLQQPDQGFAFYQAFEDEREIRISLLRNGTTPMTINVKIK